MVDPSRWPAAIACKSPPRTPHARRIASASVHL